MDALAARFGLSADAARRLDVLLCLMSADPFVPLSARDRAVGRILDLHIADSLVALELPAVRGARALVDLGSGAGLPGLPLALAMPTAHVKLVEASARKCRFIRRAVQVAGADNAKVINARAEDLARGGEREQADLVTARAVAPLNVTVEYGAPLLRVGGWLVVWRGRREPAQERRGARAAAHLGLAPAGVVRVQPFDGAEQRHLHLFCKVCVTPAPYPRRVGMARRHPLGQDLLSDRPAR